MENSMKDTFIHQYEHQIAHAPLPMRLAETYSLSSIIKDTTDKKVYLLKDHNEQPFVLKCCSSMYARALRQEYDFLTHHTNSDFFPNAVSFFEESDMCFLLRDYIKGPLLGEHSEHLYAHCTHFRDFEDALLPYMIECCQIISILHHENPPMIHRDIKPENFVWKETAHALILIDIDAGRQFIPSKTRDTVFTGTYGNAAPEQFGFGQSDVRTDVYGLGKTFLSLLSGNESFPEAGIDIPDLSADLATILQKATAFKPEERYMTVLQLQKALSKLQAQRSQKNKKPHSGFGRSLALLFAGIVLCSGIGSGIGIMVAQNSFHTPAVASADTQNQGSALKKSAQPVSEADTTKSADPDTSDSHAANHSLAEQAGVRTFDAYKYQDLIDTIIVAAYQNDAKSVASNLETLVSQLYEEPELTRNPPEDYSTYDVLPKGYWILSGMDAIRLRLVYRDSILKETIGSYEDYDAQLLHMLRHCLYGTNGSDTSNLYQYAHSTPDERNDYYEFCLSDLLDNIQCVLDQRDNFTCPQEADSQ